MKYISSSSYFGRGGRRRSGTVEEPLDTEGNLSLRYGPGEELADPQCRSDGSDRVSMGGRLLLRY